MVHHIGMKTILWGTQDAKSARTNFSLEEEIKNHLKIYNEFLGR